MKPRAARPKHRFPIALWLWLGLLPSVLADALEVSQAWIREGPPGMGMLAGFMTLHNPGASDLFLERVDSPRFERVEIHETRIDARGVASMRPVRRLRIPAGGTVRFAPGGLHLMLIGPDGRITAGETVPVWLQLADGARIRVPFMVRRTAPDGAMP